MGFSMRLFHYTAFHFFTTTRRREKLHIIILLPPISPLSRKSQKPHEIPTDKMPLASRTLAAIRHFTQEIYWSLGRYLALLWLLLSLRQYHLFHVYTPPLRLARRCRRTPRHAMAALLTYHFGFPPH